MPTAFEQIATPIGGLQEGRDCPALHPARHCPARRRKNLHSGAAWPRKVEHEYAHCRPWACLSALDVHEVKLVGRYEARSLIVAFDRQPPLLLVRSSIHASWLSQIEVHFSVHSTTHSRRTTSSPSMNSPCASAPSSTFAKQSPSRSVGHSRTNRNN